MIKTLPSNAGDMGLIPDSEMEILLAVWCAKKKTKKQKKEGIEKDTPR